MKPWIYASLCSAVIGSIWTLSVKKGIMSIFATDFASWYGFVASLILMGYNLVTGIGLRFNLWGAIAGIFQGGAVVLSTISMSKSPNPGLTIATFRVQSIVTAILAYLIFGSSLSVYKIVAMAVVIYGVHMISETKNETFNGTQAIEPKKNEKTSKAWVLLAILGGISMSIKDITTKQAFLAESKPNTMVIILNSLIVQTIIVFIYDKISTGTIKPRDLNQDHVINYKDWIIIAWTGLIYVMYNFGVATSTKLAPNVGYAKAIITFSVIISTITAHYLYKSALTTKSMTGVCIIVAGIVCISIM